MTKSRVDSEAVDLMHQLEAAHKEIHGMSNDLWPCLFGAFFAIMRNAAEIDPRADFALAACIRPNLEKTLARLERKRIRENA